MTDTPPARRRGPYPEPLVVERRRTVFGEHTHRQPRWPIVSLAVLVLVQTVAIVVLAFYVVDFQAYVSGRGEYRDREAARQEERMRRGLCDLLDTLPVSPLLDEARRKYGCGPGVPRDELPPEVQQQLQDDDTPPPALRPPEDLERADRSRPRPEPSEGASPERPPATAPAPAPTQSTLAPAQAERAPTTAVPSPELPPPATEPDPLLDLEPVTDPICRLLAVCF